MKFFFCGASNLIYRFLKEEDRFPKIISDYFNAEMTIDAFAGSNTKRVIRKVFYEYNMNEYDFIILDFPPESRTEFYNPERKEWDQYEVTRSKSVTNYYKKLNIKTESYYNHIYNSEYGLLQEQINFMIIKKYLTAINKPHIIISSSVNKKKEYLPFDYYLIDYDLSHFHLTKEGHKILSQDIIKDYENILQR